VIVSFTGHRPDKLGGYNENNSIANGVKGALLKEILKLIQREGAKEFISGGALGVDTWAAEAVLEAKKTYPQTLLTIAKPFPSQDGKWLDESKVRFKKFCDAADRVVNVSGDPYSADKMQIRNEWMVNHSDVVVAIWDGSSGGTGNCVKYAKRQGKRLIVINPKDTLVSESPDGPQMNLL
jgi:uncharacterized phage-like protein YoqJ